MKAGGGHRKGATFERDICRQLSLWWTDNVRDDIFWRTPQSGGRATRREQKGKGTAGNYGDIMAVDQIGIPLINFMTFELKYGYGLASAMDLVDGSSKSLWRKWIIGAQRVCDEAGSLYWALIVRRHQKRCVICYPEAMHIAFSWPGPFRDGWPTRVKIKHLELGTLMVMQLDDFLTGLRPGFINEVLEDGD